MADVIVIGAGVNGLVTGILLARQRLSTVIVDRQPQTGGAAVTFELLPDFKVPALSPSAGPLHADVVRALGLDRVAGLDWLLPDPALTSLTEDGPLVFHRDPVVTASAINPRSAADAGRWRPFLQTAHRLANVIGAINRQPPPLVDDTSAGDWWRLFETGRRARALGPRDLSQLARWLPMPVGDLVSEWFETEALRAAIAARAIYGNFAGPRSGGTGALLLQRLADDPLPVGGGVTLKGGPGALASVLTGLATAAGATVRTGARVARIVTANGRARAVVLDDGSEIAAQTIVSAVDPRQTFLSLVDPVDLPPTFLARTRHIRARGVTAKINLALAGLPSVPSLGGDLVPLRGRLLVAPTLEYLERAFDAAKYGRISDRPWLELVIPSVLDPSLAPAGQHVMSITAHFAPRTLRDGGWPESRESLYRAALDALAPFVHDLEGLVLGHQVVTPEDLEHFWGIDGGHIFHGEPTLDQSWVARPLLGCANYRTPIEGLFLAGAGVHPGGGLTGLSGLLAAKAVERAKRR